MTLLVDAVGKVSFAVFVALVAVALLRQRSAALRHYVLSIAVLAAAAIPAATRVVPSWQIGSRRPATSTEMSARDVMGAAATTTAVALTRESSAPTPMPARRPIALPAVLAGVWAVGAGVSLLILLAGFGRLRWLASRSARVSRGIWFDELARIAAEERIARPVRLLQSDHPTLLVTWGAAWPTIILPQGAAAWRRERVDVVLRHELAHIRRCDWLVQVLAAIVRLTYWFNPLVWIACARIRSESEQACDDAVIGAGVAPAEYAAHLLDLARTLRSRRHGWLPAHGIAKTSHFERRVTAMLNARVNRSPMSRAGRLAAGAAVVFVAVLVAGFGAPQRGAVFSGTVVDAMGRPLRGVAVELADPQAESHHEVRTDASGKFAFVALPPGSYTLRTTQLGFAPLSDTVALSGAGVQRTLTLQLASVQESIRVSDVPPASPKRDARSPEEIRARVRATRANDPCAQSADGGCILPPLKVKDVRPVYPESLKGSGLDAVVVLKGTIGTDGAVRGLEVVSSPHADLSSAAIAAVEQWQFEPTHLDGVVVETGMTVTVRFATTR